jgi:hypothetical protein
LTGLFRTAYKKWGVVLNRLQKKGNQTFTILNFISFDFLDFRYFKLTQKLYHQNGNKIPVRLVFLGERCTSRLFLFLSPHFFIFQYFLSPLGLKKLAIKSVFLVSDNLLCLKPKTLWKWRRVGRVGEATCSCTLGRMARVILTG